MVHWIVRALAVWSLLFYIETLCDIIFWEGSVGGSVGEFVSEGGNGLVVGLNEIVEVGEYFADVFLTLEQIVDVLLVFAVWIGWVGYFFVSLCQIALHWICNCALTVRSGLNIDDQKNDGFKFKLINAAIY